MGGFKSTSRNVDLRVSTLPTQFGEGPVLRVLDRSIVNLDLKRSGCLITSTIFFEMIERPNGIFIATGPTGRENDHALPCFARSP
jgi:type II secretory ATPase GspE/PulE/Tfp pilus assembly ATPase PilB-like protein